MLSYAPSRNAAVDSELLRQLTALLQRPSVTPDDAGCQDYLSGELTALGFHCRRWHLNGVDNMVARLGTGPVRIAFAGHTDVVPPGDSERWQAPPFAATVIDNEIIGRGVADMKGAIAAIMAAIKEAHRGWDLDQYSFYLLLTSDEEGEAEHGTRDIVHRLAASDELPHLCIVGEPSADESTGDVIKVGRRGAISGELLIRGKAGHVAYPQFADNAAHKVTHIARQLCQLKWDSGSDDFPGTSLQITAIDTGPWTDNVIPGDSRLCFNLRFSHHHSIDSIQARIEALLACHGDSLELSWLRPCEPYLTETGQHQGRDLVAEAEQAIMAVTHRFPRLSTSGGTSDGRFIARAGCQVVELGLPNHTIHQINERASLTDLRQLQAIYTRLLLQLMGSRNALPAQAPVPR